MPRLYCNQHGKEHEARVHGQEAVYRLEGERVVIVIGKLISGPWLCDRCNALLKKGRPAYLLTALPCWTMLRIEDYDFAYERRYFAIEKTEVRFYGAEGPREACD